MSGPSLTQRYEDQNWWDHAEGYINDLGLDILGFFLPTVANDIKEATREEDIEALDKAISNAYKQLAGIYYNHKEDPKIQKAIDKIEGIYNFMSTSSPAHYHIHHAVIKDERDKLKKLQEADDKLRKKGEASAEAQKYLVNQDIDKMYNYKANPDSIYSSGSAIKKDFANVVDKYIKKNERRFERNQ